MAYCLQGDFKELQLEDLLDITLNGLASKHDKLREGALKLLGSVVSSHGKSPTPSSLKVLRLKTALASIANLDVSSSARALAEKLLPLFESD